MPKSYLVLLEITIGLFTVGIFGPFLTPFLGHSHDSHYFSLLFSFILINGGNEKVRMEEKSKKIVGIMRMVQNGMKNGTKIPTVNNPNEAIKSGAFQGVCTFEWIQIFTSMVYC